MHKSLLFIRTLGTLRMACDDAIVGPCCCMSRALFRTRSGESSWTVEKDSPVKCGDLKFWGKSIAGYGTCVINPEMGVMFDAGCMPEGAENIGVALISHGHG